VSRQPLRVGCLALAWLGGGCEVSSVVGENDPALTGPSTISCEDDATLRRCGKTDCVVTELGPAHPGVLSIEVDGAGIYLSLQAEELSRMPLQGGPGAFLAATVQLSQFSADESHLYWTEFSGDIMRVAKDGGGSEVLVHADGHPTALDVDGDDLSFAIPDRNEVAMVDVPSRTLRRLSGQATPADVALDAAHVYWVNEGSGELMRAARGDIGAAEVLQAGLVQAHKVAVDGARVYWLAGDRLFAATKTAGAAPEELLAGIDEIHALRAFDGVAYLAGKYGLLRVAGGAASVLEPRPITGLTLDCTGVYATGWYDSFVIRYGD
jgi:hypothetical protein